MATVRVIVNSALRKLGRLAGGREPRLSDQTDTTDVLRGMYGAWISAGAFGRLCDVAPVTGYVTAGGERIYRTTATVFDVVLPTLVADGGSDYGCQCWATVVTIGVDGSQSQVTRQWPTGSQAPRDGSPVVISDLVGGQTRSYLYDGSVKQWQPIDDLTLDDDAPRSSSDPDGLAACLAMEVADQFGADVAPATAAAAARFKVAMTSGFGMRRVESQGVYV